MISKGLTNTNNECIVGICQLFMNHFLFHLTVRRNDFLATAFALIFYANMIYACCIFFT